MAEPNETSGAAVVDDAAIRRWLCERLAETTGAAPDAIDIRQPFNSMGVTSKDAVSIAGELEEWLGCRLSESLLYDFVCVADLADHIAAGAGGMAVPARAAAPRPETAGPARPGKGADQLCVTAMTCRFPDADSTAEFWQNLLDGKDSAAEIPAERWDAAAQLGDGTPASGTVYTSRGAFIRDPARFDAAFFDITPREAARMDPRQRILLELCWQAMEDCGLTADRLRDSRTGVFVGMMGDSQFANLQLDQGGACLDDPVFGTGTAPSVAAGRLAYRFGLRGPCVVVDTACSSALVALHLAMRAIAAGDCDRALVGGASLTAHPDSVRQACAMRLLATDGRTKTFDAAADGFLLGEGAGVLMVERMSAAVARRARVLAVLRGSATNQDGATNGLTAPSRQAQIDVIRGALTDAGLSPDDIDYVEAHGTGTALGDAIEAAGLQEVFIQGRSRKRPLVVGAVKTNVGHLTGAAGLAGLFKVVLALGHGRIPPNLHLRTPNPAIRWSPETVTLPGHVLDWPHAAIPRRASVSSFGWSGSNAHVVVEQAPPLSYERGPDAQPGDPWQAILVSARTRGQVGEVAAGLASALADAGDSDALLADVAYTTQAGRSALPHRAAVVCGDVAAARRELGALSQAPRSRRAVRHNQAQVAYLLPGTGDQYAGAGQALYETEPAFRDTLRLCAGAAAAAGVDILRWLYPEQDTGAAADTGGGLRAMLGRADPAPESPLTSQVDVAHAAVFALDVACAALWRRIGISPAAVLGYSLGEYAAATVAGVFDPADAIRLVIDRARLVSTAPPGVMLTVAAPAERVTGILGTGLDLAADTGPLACVVAGAEPGIAALEALLARQDIACRRIPTTRAMHSRLMLPVRDQLIELLGSTRRRPPAIPIVSNRTGEPLTAQQAMDPEYWADHMCRTVRFADGVRGLAGQGVAAILDLGSGQLASLATQVLSARPGGAGTFAVAASLPPLYRRGSEREVLIRAAAQLWEAGAPADWSVLRRQDGKLTALPGYPFDQRRFWPGLPRAAGTAVAADVPEPGRPADPRPQVASLAPAKAGARLYTPGWEAAPVPLGAGTPAGPVLILTDDAELGGALAARLAPASCVRVRSGIGFTESGGVFTVRPGAAADYEQLLAQLGRGGLLPRTIVHLWSAAETGTASGAGSDGSRNLVASVRDDHEAGFSSLLALGKALPPHVPDGARLLVVTTGASAVRPGEPVRLGRGTVAGLALTLPQEHPGIAVRTLDIPPRGPGGGATSRLAELAGHIVTELSWPGAGPVVAVREGARLVRGYRPLTPQADPAPSQVALRERGVYLVTGGLGRIGLMAAAHLARRARARLVLTSRQGLPPRDRWASLLDAPADGDPTVRRIRAVQSIEAQGAEVMVAALDAADEVAVRDLVRAVRARFGGLNGVIHAAGTTDPAAFVPVADLGADGASAHLMPKVYGTLALDAALEGCRLDFCLAMSSMSSVLGGVAFSGYAAANAFLDLLADSAAGHQRWTAVNWDTWKSTVDGPGLRDLRSTTLDRYSITPEDGVGLLEALLAGERPRVIVAAADLEQRVRQWATPADPFQAASTPTAPVPAGDDRVAGPAADRPDLAVPYVAPRTACERRVASLWSAAIGIQQIGVNDNFFDLGGNSLVGMQLVTSLTREFGRPIPTVALFEAPTVAALAAYLDDQAPDAAAQRMAPDAVPPAWPGAGLAVPGARQPAASARRASDIAIVGMAGRFPGADDVRGFWQNLIDGTESVTFFSPGELRASGVPEEQLGRPDYVPARPVLSAVDGFDAEFFGYTPREASLADPQQRLFLECVWECLEDGGYPPRSTSVPVGVFGGSNISTYLLRLAATPEALAGANEFQVVISNDKDSLTLNASYRLDLRGPSVTVQSFCSTSLLAVHLACQSLLAGECEMAVAGGVSIRVPDRVGYIRTPGGMESVDGHVRTFDARAGGAVFGDGCAVVLLKPLRRAMDDGDNIIAVIRGSAANNDGAVKVGFSAPSVRGQSEVVVRAQAAAGIDPRTVSYVEAHGTATELGDPIEVAALTRAFGVSGLGQYCAIGSVKTNVGHLDRAAGAAGLIKTALALRHRLIPASLNFTCPNPEIDFANSPFRVNSELTRWEPRDEEPLRAGVNSLGMGGTNVHVVLEEAPLGPGRPPLTGQPEALVLSARTPESLAAARDALGRHLAGFRGDLRDVAFTLQTGREEFEYRLAVLAGTASEAAGLLADKAPPGEAGPGFASLGVRYGQAGAGPVLPVFGLAEPDPRPDAARALYRSDAALARQLDAACAALPGLLGVLAGSGDVAPADGIRAGLLVQYVLAVELRRCGIRPAAILAHPAALSVAAALAGVLPIEQALGQPDGAQAGPLAEPRIPCLMARNGEALPVALADVGQWTALTAEPAAELARRIAVPGAPENATPLLAGLGPDGARRLVSAGWPGDSAQTWPLADGPARGDSWLAASWLAALWLRGAEVDWAALHAGRQPRRTSLPTYQFQRKHYWIDPPPGAASGAAAARRTAAAAAGSDDSGQASVDPAQELAGLAVHPERDWLWRPGWRSAPGLPAPDDACLAQPWLLFADEAGLARRTGSSLRAAGGSAILVTRGQEFGQSGDRSFTIDPDDPEHYQQLLRACRERGWAPAVVGHFWSLDHEQGGDDADAADGLLSGLVRLIQALGSDGAERMVRVVTTGVFRVTGHEAVIAHRAAATGPVLVTPLEYPQLSTRLVDIEASPAARRGARLPDILLAELADGRDERQVAVRGGRRWIPDMRRLPAPRESDPGSVLRPGGAYLITGGLGGIGLAMAERLAAACSARLALVGRHGLPEPAQWDVTLADPGCPPELARRIEAVRRLRADGAEVMVIAADVARPGGAAQAVGKAVARFGRLDGVIHAAGIPGIGLMALKDPAAMSEVLGPKVAGTQALLAALADVPVDFVALFSSMAAVTGGGPGQADYCSANAYLDAVAQGRPAGGTRVVSIDWGEWQWNGWELALEGFGEAATEFLRVNRERTGIGFDDGWRCLTRALALREPQLVVSPVDVPELIRLSAQLTVPRIAALSMALDEAVAGTRYPRPRLSTPFEPPPEGLAAGIAELWGAALGLDQVGMHDNFFELGGNSLLAVGLIERIRRLTKGAAIPPHVLYEVPTVAGLVHYLSETGAGSAAMPDHARAPGDDPGADDLSTRRDRGFWRRESAAAAGRRRS